MPRQLFGHAERAELDRFPESVSAEELKTHYHLSEADLEIVSKQRRDGNRLGFALQLGALRHLGFVPADLLGPPADLLGYLADQLRVSPASLRAYRRQPTRSGHLREAMSYLGYRRVTPLDDAELSSWLAERATEHDGPRLLFGAACDFLKRRRILRPGLTHLERSVSEARQAAHRLTYERLRPTLTQATNMLLKDVLSVPEGQTRSRLAWLQRAVTAPEVGQLKDTLRKLDYLQAGGVADWDLSAVNPNRLKWLARLGAKSRRQTLLRSDPGKRACILVAFLHQLLYSLTDDALFMFDQRLWDLYGSAKSDFETDRRRARRDINENLSLLQSLGELLLDPDVGEAQIRAFVFGHVGREALAERLKTNAALLRPERDEHLDYFRAKHGSLRNVLKPLLKTLRFESWGEDGGLLEALQFVQELHTGKRRRVPNAAPTAFVPEAWLPYLFSEEGMDRHYYEMASAWVLRERLRSGSIFVATSKRFTPVESYLIPRPVWPSLRTTVSELTGTPLGPEARLAERLAELETLCLDVESRLTGKQGGLRVEAGRLALSPDVAAEKDLDVVSLGAAIGANLDPAAIPDIVLEVDRETGFSKGFEYLGLRGRDLPDDLLYLYACLLAQGCNLGFAAMAQSAGLSHAKLARFSDLYISRENLVRANALLVNAHHALPYSRVWGGGMLSSSDGQRFPMSARGKTPKARHNPRYFGLGKGVTFYTWTSDQFSQYGFKAVPATLRDATYVLDAILDNETDLEIAEHSTDTGGYSELVFAVFDLLGLRFTPRIRDLKEQTLYRSHGLDLSRIPRLAPCLTGVLREGFVSAQWDEMLRFIGSLKLGYVTASLLVQKLQAYPRQHPLFRALQAYGRLPKTLHILRWYGSRAVRRDTTRQLNKGESLHELRAHLAFGNRGKLGTKTDEQLTHQVGCLNLLTNIVIYYNTLKMRAAVEKLRARGRDVSETHLGSIWPTRFSHINVYGSYRFDREGIAKLQAKRA